MPQRKDDILERKRSLALLLFFFFFFTAIYVFPPFHVVGILLTIVALALVLAGIVLVTAAFFKCNAVQRNVAALLGKILVILIACFLFLAFCAFCGFVGFFFHEKIYGSSGGINWVSIWVFVLCPLLLFDFAYLIILSSMVGLIVNFFFCRQPPDGTEEEDNNDD